MFLKEYMRLSLAVDIVDIDDIVIDIDNYIQNTFELNENFDINMYYVTFTVFLNCVIILGIDYWHQW